MICVCAGGCPVTLESIAGWHMALRLMCKARWGNSTYLSASVRFLRQLIPPASKASRSIGFLPQGLDLHQG